MESIVTSAAEFIARMKRTGQLQQFEDSADTVPSLIEERRNWAAELAGITARRAKELPPLAKAVAHAAAELELAEQKVLEARRAHAEATLRAYGAQYSVDGRERQLKLLLEGVQHPQVPNVEPKPVPAVLLYLRQIWERLELMRTNLRHAAHATHERHERDWMGRARLTELWNVQEVENARHKLDDIQDELRSLMRQPDFDPPKQRARADELLRIAETEVEPLFKGSPGEDFYRQEKMRLFGVRKSAA